MELILASSFSFLNLKQKLKLEISPSVLEALVAEPQILVDCT